MSRTRVLKRIVHCLAVGLFGLLELVGLPWTPGNREMKENHRR